LKPSVAVLPFTNTSGDREKEYFADGMVEEIDTVVSRLRRYLSLASDESRWVTGTVTVDGGYLAIRGGAVAR
jgi:TolB-like protein